MTAPRTPRTDRRDAHEIVGTDAVFLHLERHDSPTHTLKVVELDTTDRGRPVTLTALTALAATHLDVSPRLTQRVARRGRRLVWEPVEVDLPAHLDEVVVGAAGHRDLDQVCARLSMAHLDRTRPLWSLTLVHGLPGGRQAVVARVHHAIADGIASINLLTALTSAAPTNPSAPAATPTRTAPAIEVRGTAADAARTPLRVRLATLVRERSASRRAARGSVASGDVPRGLVPRTPLNTPSGHQRLCASCDVSLARVRDLATLADTTVNGALHAVIAAALRAYFLDHGLEPTAPLVAAFGVADGVDPTRTHGNGIATARVFLRADRADPLALVADTARSCAAGVQARRTRGFAAQQRALDAFAPLAGAVRATAAHRTPLVTNHITTANVPGPREQRWAGDVAVTGWRSYSLVLAPADVNLTAYSYAGTISIGLVSTPESLPDPAGLLRRVQVALDELIDAFAPPSTAAAAYATERA